MALSPSHPVPGSPERTGAGPGAPGGFIHRWAPPPDAAPLMATGATFEVAEEEVRGRQLPVFRRRPGHLGEALAFAAGTHDAQTYLFDAGDERALSFADTLASVRRVAAVLSAHGVGPGDRVGITARNSAAHAVTWWATVALGAVAAGYNTWWTTAEAAHANRLCAPKVIVVDGPSRERLGSDRGAPALLDIAALAPLLGPSRADDPPSPEAPTTEDDPAVILFTSGTTGRSKGATLSHRAVVHSAMLGLLSATIDRLGRQSDHQSDPSQSSMLMPSPLFHASGALPLVGALLSGTKLVFPPPQPWDERTHLELTERHRPRSWTGVPTQFWRLLEHPDFDRYDTSSVESLGGGGAVFAPELFNLMAEKLPQAAPGVAYGMSETFATGTRLQGVTLTTHPASVGEVQPLTEIQLRDLDDRPVPDGCVGQICIRGACNFLGYWKDPAATAEVLDDEGWYRTGDYGRFVDGVLHLESRMRDLIIRGGENVYPIEIENRLVEHDAIAEAAVVGVDDRRLGQQVGAVIVVREGASLTEDEVQHWVAATLASFKVPSVVRFRTALPYSATGKVLKRELEAELAGATG